MYCFGASKPWGPCHIFKRPTRILSSTLSLSLASSPLISSSASKANNRSLRNLLYVPHPNTLYNNVSFASSSSTMLTPMSVSGSSRATADTCTSYHKFCSVLLPSYSDRARRHHFLSLFTRLLQLRPHLNWLLRRQQCKRHLELYYARLPC